MNRSVGLAISLWCLLAVIVFNVTFDWETRMASYRFVASQLQRQERHQAPLTINDGFRPMVRAAAQHSAVWLVLMAAAGIAASAAAGKRTT